MDFIFKELKYKVENISRQLETFSKESNGNYRNKNTLNELKIPHMGLMSG